MIANSEKGKKRPGPFLPFSLRRKNMLEKIIEYESHQFIKGKRIKGKLHTYVEYKNSELGKIKFFEIENGNRKEITDKEDLKDAIEKNYIIEENV